MKFARQIALAVVALAIGFGGVLLFWAESNDLPFFGKNAQFLKATELRVAQGKSFPVADDSLRLVFEGHASPIEVEAPFDEFDAGSMMAVRLHTDALPSGAKGTLYWRRADTNKIHGAAIPRRAGATPLVDLSRATGWKGEITDVRLILVGRPSSTVVLHGIELLPKTVGTRLETVVSDYRFLETWSYISINYLAGNAKGDVTTAFMAPAAILAGLAIAFVSLALMHRTTRRLAIAAGAICFFAVWLALDARWQRTLNHNLSIAKQDLADKTWEEKQLAGPDARLYEYAENLKRSVLPVEPQRVFILHKNTNQDFRRLRFQYHLLPHNVYNFGKELDPAFIQPGDYVVLLGVVPGIHYKRTERLLKVGTGRWVNAELADLSQLGAVFKITPGES